MPVQNNFDMFEGIDGSGKTTLAKIFIETLASRGHKTVFDLVSTCKATGELPLPWQPGNEIIFSAEPTKVWIGAAIRGELTRTGTGYSGTAVAQAFALDRLVLYSRLLIPMLERGAMVVQDRGLPSSMTYQPIMENSMPLEELLALPGNALALEHAPGHLIIAKCSAKTAVARLAARSDKKDDSTFEREDFLGQLAERYESDWLRQIWERQGAKVHYLNAEQPLEAVKADTIRLANELYPA